ncbi:MAG: type II toxin-antitoxin system VapC family toxin [Candidatus Thorarchaeota archaeon]|nr:type II toxin-antitoxin system VapC family toxin [Candidatus Thorarchaeota archaeon]
MIIVDSNIWAYYFDVTQPEHVSVIQPLESLLHRSQAAISAVIALETFHYLIKRLGPRVGAEKARIFMGYKMPLYELDLATVELTVEKLSQFTQLGIGGRDASILATMEQEGIKKIMTHDSAFKRVDTIKVIDPIQ